MTVKSKRDLILSASIELFAEFGYGCTSVEDISKKVNVAKGTIYNYFKSKKEILEAIITKHETLFFKSIDQFSKKYDLFEDFLFNCVKMVFDYFYENIDELRVINSILYLKNQESREFLDMHYNILFCNNRAISRYINSGQISSEDFEILHIIISGLITELVFYGDINKKKYTDKELKIIIKRLTGEKK